MLALFTYLKHRLAERSSWLAIAAGVTAASALEWPWNVVFLSISVIGVLVPEQGTGDV